VAHFLGDSKQYILRTVKSHYIELILVTADKSRTENFPLSHFINRRTIFAWQRNTHSNICEMETGSGSSIRTISSSLRASKAQKSTCASRTAPLAPFSSSGWPTTHQGRKRKPSTSTSPSPSGTTCPTSTSISARTSPAKESCLSAMLLRRINNFCCFLSTSAKT
jgi:hypothetical protein